mmetsp:Transcript_67080/g.160789  ORF Transcript_67080/g.160789 Transcript_67080/m.160789 type:complete len:227 (+) Transcript_67080:115-795(+)
MQALARIPLRTGAAHRVLSSSILRQSVASPLRHSQASFSAAAKVSKVLSAEIKGEEEQYEKPKEVTQFLKSSAYQLVEKEGDVNIMLTKEVDGKEVRIEFQLMSPTYMEEEEGGDSNDATEFTVIVEEKAAKKGMTFYCSTLSGEDHRFTIGQVATHASAEEAESDTRYQGPDFEDLDEQLQESLDEYLAELGVSNDLCDFIDQMALDKEQREYIRWLKSVKSFIE